MRGKPLVVGVVVAVALLGACGSPSDDTAQPVIPHDRLAELTQQKLANTAGPRAESVDCDGDLPATVGIKRRCVLTTPDGVRYGVTVTATKVDGDDIGFEAVVDVKPME